MFKQTSFLHMPCILPSDHFYSKSTEIQKQQHRSSSVRLPIYHIALRTEKRRKLGRVLCPGEQFTPTRSYQICSNLFSRESQAGCAHQECPESCLCPFVPPERLLSRNWASQLAGSVCTTSIPLAPPAGSRAATPLSVSPGHPSDGEHRQLGQN